MFGSVVIDVVIAMALVFFVFSLVTSGLREVVAWLTSTRSKVLWRSVRELLDDPISYGLQPLYEAITPAGGSADEETATKVRDAERTLRSARDRETTSEGWTTAVDSAMSNLRDDLGGGAGQLPPTLTAAIAESGQRLEDAYKEPTRLSAITDQIWHKDPVGRPRSPVVPTIGNVTLIAQSVRNGVRSFTDAVYDHPLIRQVDKTVAGKQSMLTWLEAGDFSGAALDLIQAAGVERVIEDAWEDAVEAIAGAVKGETADIADALRSSLSELQGHIVAGTANSGVVRATMSQLEAMLLDTATSDESRKAIDDALESIEARLMGIEPLDLIERGLDALENIGPVRDTVARAAAAARGAETKAVEQLSEVGASIGAWYDARMSSLTVWYRKRSRLVGFALAFLVVLGFNVDAVDLPIELWRNETVRSALVAVAETSELDLATCLDERTDDTTTTAASGTATTTTIDTTAACVEDVEAVIDELIDTGLPIGWVAADVCNGDCLFPFETIWYSSGADSNWWSGPLKLAGWMLAAAALSMGASFWFDVMRRAMGIKAATKGDDDS